MKSEKEICKKNFEKILSMRSFLKFSQPTAGEKIPGKIPSLSRVFDFPDEKKKDCH